MLLSKNKCRAAWPSAVELRGVGGAKMQDVSISNGDGLLGGGLLSELSFNSEDFLKSIADTTEENVKKEKR